MVGNSNMFTLAVGTKINPNDVKGQLEEISKKTTLKIKVNPDTQALEKLQTVTTKSVNSLGNLVTVTENFNKKGKETQTVITTIDDKTKKANETLNKAKQSLKEVNDKIKQAKDTLSKTNKDIKSSQETLRKTKDAIMETSKASKNVNSELSKTGEASTKASKGVKSLGADFIDTTLKVAKFGLSTKIIGLFQSAIGEAKETLFEFDGALAEFKKVSDLSGESLKKFTEQAFDTASELSTSASNVIDATTEFKKSGFSDKDSQLLAKQALIFKDIADEEISASDSARTLIQVTKAYNMTAQDGEHIINALNKV